MTAKPTRLDRTEAAHWARTARHQLASSVMTIEAFDQLPHLTCEKAEAGLDEAIRLIENAKKALRGQHAQGATSRLNDGMCM